MLFYKKVITVFTGWCVKKSLAIKLFAERIIDIWRIQEDLWSHTNSSPSFLLLHSLLTFPVAELTFRTVNCLLCTIIHETNRNVRVPLYFPHCFHPFDVWLSLFKVSLSSSSHPLCINFTWLELGNYSRKPFFGNAVFWEFDCTRWDGKVTSDTKARLA